MRSLGLLLVGSLAAACAPSMYIFKFSPEQVEGQVDAYGEVGEHVWSSASVIGIRQPKPESGQRPQVELTLRIENRTRSSISLDPRSIVLASADPLSIGRVVVTPEPELLAPGEAADYLLEFPFSVDETPWSYDLRRLDLSWSIDFGTDVLRTRARFVQYDPVYDPELTQRHYPNRY